MGKQRSFVPTSTNNNNNDVNRPNLSSIDKILEKNEAILSSNCANVFSNTTPLSNNIDNGSVHNQFIQNNDATVITGGGSQALQKLLSNTVVKQPIVAPSVPLLGAVLTPAALKLLEYKNAVAHELESRERSEQLARLSLARLLTTNTVTGIQNTRAKSPNRKIPTLNSTNTESNYPLVSETQSQHFAATLPSFSKSSLTASNSGYCTPAGDSQFLELQSELASVASGFSYYTAQSDTINLFNNTNSVSVSRAVSNVSAFTNNLFFSPSATKTSTYSAPLTSRKSTNLNRVYTEAQSQEVLKRYSLI